VFAVTTKDGQQKLPDALLLPSILIVASLALDLLQYVLSAAVYGICARVLELKKVSPEREMVQLEGSTGPQSPVLGKLALSRGLLLPAEVPAADTLLTRGKPAACAAGSLFTSSS
jgi:hypothetical protein